MTDAISAAEHADRRARLSEHVRTLGAAGYVVCDPTYITYFTGFRFLSTERPRAAVGARTPTGFSRNTACPAARRPRPACAHRARRR
jgi:hypothetical protein